MENDIIKLSLGDWVWNAAVTGFVNIVGAENVIYKGTAVEVPADCLEGFEEKYFNYFIGTYEKTLSWYKIVSFENTIGYYNDNGFETLDLKGLVKINEYIKDTVKRYLTSNSFKAAFELIGGKEDIEALEKELQKIKEPKDQASFEREKNNIVEAVKKQFEVLDRIIEYCRSDSGRRFIGAKNVIYSIIKNGWNGVCFLNPQTKIKDIYEDYKMYFVDEAREYLLTSKDKYKYRCFTCGAEIKDFGNDMSFVNQSGFDTARKPSHVWNFVNDIALCPVCKLVYSCIPAGFVYVNDKGLYINANVNMKDNIRINRNVRDSVFRESKENVMPRRIYGILVEAMKRENINKDKYELADVQVVRYENESYKFNLLPEITIKLINRFHEEINGLSRTRYKEGSENFSIYEQVLGYIFNNQNLFLLVNKLLHYKLSSPNDCFFYMRHVVDMLKINTKLIQNLGGMENMDKDRDYLREARGAGYHLKKAYLDRDPKTGKNPGISYRLLNALKTSNRNMFMDLVLNCYLYIGKEIPRIITDILKDDDEMFSTIGYAFVASFIDGEGDSKNDSVKTEGGEEI